MHRGEIFLYSGKGVISWLIKKVTKSKWSHCGWIFKDHKVVEANAEGVEALQFDYDVEKCAFIELQAVKDTLLEDILRYAEEKVGQPYDYKLFFGLFWRWIFGWRRKTEVPDWPNGYICSEIVAIPLFMRASIRMHPDVHPINTVPEDIWQWAEARPDQAKITHVGKEVS